MYLLAKRDVYKRQEYVISDIQIQRIDRRRVGNISVWYILDVYKRQGYALAMFFFSLALCVFVGFLHGITSQICLMLMFFTGVQAAIFVHQKQCLSLIHI